VISRREAAEEKVITYVTKMIKITLETELFRVCLDENKYSSNMDITIFTNEFDDYDLDFRKILDIMHGLLNIWDNGVVINIKTSELRGEDARYILDNIKNITRKERNELIGLILEES
jgi:hypothetical protein